MCAHLFVSRMQFRMDNNYMESDMNQKASHVHNEEACLSQTTRSPARLLVGEKKTTLAMVYLTDEETRKRTLASDERVRRLVACWNAMVGMSTEDIEFLATDNKRKRQALEADERSLAG